MSNQNLNYTLSLRDLFTRQMGAAIGATQRMDRTVQNLGSSIKQYLGLAAITAFAKGIIETGSSFELAEVQLKTLLKSSIEAKRVFNDLKQESTTSPFGFETLLKGNAALISTGISADKAKKDFNALANAIAATGGGEDALNRMVFNLQQIKNVGKATAMDIKQFGMAGINIYQLLTNYSKKYKVSIDANHASYEQVVAALQLAAEKGGAYYGALQNASQTTAGQISNLKDKFALLQDTIYKNLQPTINKLLTNLSDLFDWIGKNISTIKMWIKFIGGLVIAWKAYQIAVGIAEAAQIALNVAMAANPLGLVVAAIAAVVAAIGYLITNYERLKEEYQQGITNRAESSIKGEQEAVIKLADRYKELGLAKTKAKAIDMAIAQETKSIQQSRSQLEKEAVGLSGDKLRANMARQAEYASAMTALADKTALKNRYLGLGANGETTPDGKGGAAGGASSIGTGSEATTSRPQNLTINIGKLVETQVIKAADLKESASKIKDAVSQVLLEAVNDVNTITK